MSSPDALSVPLTILQLWWREYRSTYTTRVLLLSTGPRFVLQVTFYALLGRVVAGPEGLSYAFVGAVCCIPTLSTIVGTPDVLETDKYSGTLYRLRLGDPGLTVVAFCRAPLFAIEGLLGATAAIVVAGPVLGLGELALHLIALLPLLAVIVASTTALGLVTAALTTGRRTMLISNLLCYLIFLTSGAIVSTGSIPLLAAVGGVLPVTHGLAAVREALAGESFAANLALEAVVGVCWLVVAIGALAIQDHRSRREPIDEYV